MKRGIILLLLFGALVSHAQIVKDNSLTIGKTDSLYSHILKERRKLWIYTPKDYDKNKAVQKYPVIYLLDGNNNFSSVTGIVQYLSEVSGNTKLPKMIVIGILNTDRTRDLTPTADTIETHGKPSGGGEQFTGFIREELIPYIDSAYSTSPYRILIGHSLGGLLVVNTLLKHTNLFDAYIAIDPSLWWDNQNLLKQTPGLLSQHKYNNRKLYLGIANTLKPGMDTLSVKKDTSNNTIHIRSIFTFRDQLKNNGANGLSWDYKYYPEDVHGSVGLITAYDALRLFFKTDR